MNTNFSKRFISVRLTSCADRTPHTAFVSGMLTQRIQVSMNMPIILKPRNLVPTKLNNCTVGPYYKENERSEQENTR